MSKESKAGLRILAGVSLLILVVLVIFTWTQQKDVDAHPTTISSAEHPRTAFQMQAVTFSEGYDARLDPPESVDEAIKVLKNAQILCAYLDEDPDLASAWTYGTDQLDMSSDQTVVVIEEGIHAFCPRHTPLLSEGE